MTYTRRQGALLPWLCAVALCAACAPDRVAATAIVVSVKTDLKIGSELRELSYRVFRANSSGDGDAPVAEFSAAAQTLAHPFVILRQREDELMLSVEGFAAPGEGPVVVARVRARFVQGKSLALHVFLARACLFSLCGADGLTCFGETYGEALAGECSAIPGPDALDEVLMPGDESDWQPAHREASDLDAGQSARTGADV
ncbi:MAG: hypothetical protein JWN04_6229 [Myxococcaceae bacterium]|nr:hypothetical protein [Myxococcaceae bacterium]